MKKRTLPQVLTLILLLVNLLLNKVLVLRVFGVDNHYRLPAAGARLGVLHLKGGRHDKHDDGESLRVDTRLDELLSACEILILADDRERDTHGREPRRKDDGVSVLAAPLLELLHLRLVGFRLGDGARRRVLVAVHGVLFLAVADGLAVGVDDGAKGRGRGDEEGAERQSELAEGRVALACEEDAAETDGQTGRAADEAGLDDDAVVLGLLFFAEDLHDCGLCGVVVMCKVVWIFRIVEGE